MKYELNFHDLDFSGKVETDSINGLKQMHHLLSKYIENCEREAEGEAKTAQEARYFPQEKFCEPKGKDYGIGDYVKLTPRHGDAEAIRVIQRWGSWWKARAATKGGAAWLLLSIGDQPREMPKAKVHELLMMKDLDPYFAVIGVMKFPCDFKYKVAELQVRINAE